MFETSILISITLTFLLAGTVKGITGLGLPTVSLAILTVVLDLPTAMALLLVPSFATNLWQALAGGQTLSTLKKLWPFLLTATVTVSIGAAALSRVDLDLLSELLGLLLIIYGGLNLIGFRFQLSATKQRWCGPLFGTVNGILTGMTGSFVVPGVLYLQACGLPRDALIHAMGMLFTLSTLALGVALQGNNLLTYDQALISGLALLPAVAGMLLGQKIRRRLSDAMFRRVFFTALLLLGVYIVGNTL